MRLYIPIIPDAAFMLEFINPNDAGFNVLEEPKFVKLLIIGICILKLGYELYVEVVVLPVFPAPVASVAPVPAPAPVLVLAGWLVLLLGR